MRKKLLGLTYDEIFFQMTLNELYEADNALKTLDKIGYPILDMLFFTEMEIRERHLTGGGDWLPVYRAALERISTAKTEQTPWIDPVLPLGPAEPLPGPAEPLPGPVEPLPGPIEPPGPADPSIDFWDRWWAVVLLLLMIAAWALIGLVVFCVVTLIKGV